MSAIPEDDFSNFFDLDNVDLNFSVFDNSALDTQGTHQANTQDDNAMQQQLFDMQQYNNMQTMPGQMEDIQQEMLVGHTAAVDFAMQQPYQQQQHYGMPSGQGYQQHFNVPATPESAEMLPSFVPLGHELNGHMPYGIQQHFQMRKEDVVRQDASAASGLE